MQDVDGDGLMPIFNKHSFSGRSWGPALALALLAGVALAASTDAKPGNKGGGGQPGNAQPENTMATPEKPSVGEIVFGEIERRVIGDYFRQNPYVPDANTKALPHGIQKKLARGGVLPPGISKRYLPGDLDAKLPRRDGYERVIHGEDVYLIQQGTGIILDILEGVLRAA
jgi:hypothetical protein